MEFYYYSLCHVCKKPSPDLKKCSKCKVLHYCSREHQIQDWPAHKELCKTIAGGSEILECSSGGDVDEFNCFKLATGLLWAINLGRDLSALEHQMWMFPQVCAVCYSEHVNMVCQVCLSVSYCSENHRQSHDSYHKKFCGPLKLCLEIYQSLHGGFDFADFYSFTIKKEVDVLPGNIDEVMEILQFESGANYSANTIKSIVLTDIYSQAVTVTYALQKSRFLNKRRGRKQKLVIHVVAGEMIDNTDWLRLIEFLSLWILNLKMVKIFLISPEVRGEEQLIVTDNHNRSTHKRLTAMLISLEGEYNQFVEIIPRPDLVVIFNTDLHESGRINWRENIHEIIHYKGVPVLLTSYTERDLNKDAAMFPPSLIKFFVKPQVNSYGSKRPVRNCEEGCQPAIYRNNFVAIFVKK